MEKTDARDVLRQIILTYGRSVAADPRRLESLLRDLCGSQKREITLLLSAVRENVPTDLTSVSSATVPRDILLARLRARLEENLSITPQAAQWAVESWALALDQIPSNSLTTDQLISDRNAKEQNAAAQSPILDRPVSPPQNPVTPNYSPQNPPPQEYRPPQNVPPAGPGFVPASQPAPNTPVTPGYAQAGPQVYSPPQNQYSPPQNQQVYPPVSPRGGFDPFAPSAPQSRATLALVLGIVGILGSWACGLGLLAAIPAWVFGSGEMKAITQGRLPEANKSQAQVGMVLGIVGVVLTIALGALEIYLGSKQQH